MLGIKVKALFPTLAGCVFLLIVGESLALICILVLGFVARWVYVNYYCNRTLWLFV